MKRCILCLFLLGSLLSLYSTTYTRVGSKQEDWSGTYLIVYEKSATQAYVWNCDDASKNFTSVNMTTNGQIVSDNLGAYEVQLNKEGSGQYGIKVISGDNQGYIGSKAKNNGITFGLNGAQVFTLESQSPCVIIKTNSGTQQLLFLSSDNRFRIYYNKDKKWGTEYKQVSLYKVGDGPVPPAGNALDINYVQADFYACDSKFSGNYPYWSVDLTLAQAEDEEAVPMVWLQILTYSQYSIAGKYHASWTDGRAGYIHATKSCGQDCSGAYLPSSKAESGYYGVAIWDADLEITAVSKPAKPNYYTYHINMLIQDSNSKRWTLDKDVDVYGIWIDCDRSNPKSPQYMDPVPFALESSSHQSEKATSIPTLKANPKVKKFLQDGQLILQWEGRQFDFLGREK